MGLAARLHHPSPFGPHKLLDYLAPYHTQPTDVGRVARDAHAKKLVITHLMPGAVPAELAAAAGAVAVGEDLTEV